MVCSLDVPVGSGLGASASPYCTTHCDEDQDDHQNTLWERRDLAVAIAGKEEQCGQADLLDVQADEELADGLGEEQPSSVHLRLLVDYPSKEVLVHQV